MLDLIEIALSSTTDYADFERLACEVLANEGYPDIKPLGGFNDSGQDAAVERFFESTGRRSRIVFQVTTQDTVEAKLRQTIKRLDDAEVTYTGLVLATSRQLSTEREAALKKIARDLDVSLDIFERKTFLNRLSNLDNGLFVRHFPDVGKLVEVLADRKDPSDLTPQDVVRPALAFVFTSEADVARQSVIRELVLALLREAGANGATVDELIALQKTHLGNAPLLQHDQMNAIVDRLIASGLAEKEQFKIRLSEQGLERSLASEIDWQIKGSLLASDVADSIIRIVECDETTRRLIERNAKEVLAQSFRLTGLEVASQLFGRAGASNAYINRDQLVEAAKRDIDPELGELVIAAIGELFASPNEEQAAALRSYACGYVGASLIEVDPAVRELQITRMKEKVFLLDTDFLIDCIVQHNPARGASIALVRSLIECGSRVLIPESCIEEAATHASLAYRTVNHFGEGIHGLTRAEAQERINNAFAAGWFYRSQLETVDFQQYIADYYEPTGPVAFMMDVIRTSLPEQVEIGDLGKLLNLEPDRAKVAALAAALTELVRNSRKSAYRTEADIKQLAENDAYLYGIALALDQSHRGDRVLGGNCYLISSSMRFIRAATVALHQNDEISARPISLTTVLELSGKSRIRAIDFVALFDNPLLQHAVSRCRDDVDSLLDAGLSTRGKSLARLLWDLDQGLHAKIAATRQAEQSFVDMPDDEETKSSDVAYVDLVQEAKRKGYASLPSATRLFNEIEQLRSENTNLTELVDDLMSRLTTMEEQIGVFGRRRQNYLKRVARGQHRRG